MADKESSKIPVVDDFQLVEVAVPLPMHQTFTYRVPQEMRAVAAVGKRVLVPFGNRRLTGYVTGIPETAPEAALKDILDVLDDTPLFPPAMVPFFKWIADYYLHPLGEVVGGAMPAGLHQEDHLVLTLTDGGRDALTNMDMRPEDIELLNALTSGPKPLRTVDKSLKKPLSHSRINRLREKGWLFKERLMMGQPTRVKKQRWVKLQAADLTVEGLSPQRRKIISELGRSPDGLTVEKLKHAVSTTGQLIRAMVEDGQLTAFSREVYRDPLGDPIAPDTAPVLTNEQEAAVNALLQDLGNGFNACLLAGVTGSGKTEVYLRLAHAAMARGEKVLVLIPEIALISQMERRFRARFGECVAVLHSGLSRGEKYDQWRRLAEGGADIVIGARSAIFAPLARVGLIIVDEEHDDTYKQEGSLRYNARDLAVVRAKMDKGLVILGSATPSLQSQHNVTLGKFKKISLKKRVEARPMPDIRIVNLTDYRDARGIRRFISDELRAAMKTTLERKEQVLLFLNRRGFSNFPVCSACGEALRCKNCDISLTLHQKTRAYRCHYCGYTKSALSGCSGCGSSDIRLLGFGTEKIEDAVQRLFPDARVARMDRDTTARKGSLVKILKRLKERRIDVLVGTQMVTKGHDFPNITLVGIICADQSLSFPDFRAGERTFQLLTQVSGRAGRGDAPGQVILQTYTPDHFSITAAKRQDFEAFYDREILFRNALKYPPLSRMVQLRISGKDEAVTARQARVWGEKCHSVAASSNDFKDTVEILGPIEAPLARIAQHYRWQILIKCAGAARIHRFVRAVMNAPDGGAGTKGVRIAVDVDPLFML